MSRRTPPSQRTHGHSYVDGKATPEYNAWSSMKRRCLNSKTPSFKDYGGRGIRICDEWSRSFIEFLADVGLRPTPYHSLDRINNDGHYEPSNCRWASRRQQALNRRNTRFLVFEGDHVTLTELSEIAGIPFARLKSRIARGWPIERAVK